MLIHQSSISSQRLLYTTNNLLFQALKCDFQTSNLDFLVIKSPIKIMKGKQATKKQSKPLAATKGNQIDDRIDPNAYSGTFRWRIDQPLPSLPPISELSSLLEPFDLKFSGWHKYFHSRGQFTTLIGNTGADDPGDRLVQYAMSNIAVVDCLSFPLSIVKILNESNSVFQANNTVGTYQVINILCMGCSAKAEERILRETPTFDELLYLLPAFQTVNLWLIGPEISVTAENIKTCTYNKRTLHSSLFRGTISQFFRANSSYLNPSSVLFGFNTGFGNFENPEPRKYDLLLAWLPDLYFLTGTKLPCYFLCANQHADVAGELQIMYSVLGASFMLMPQENPFAFASTLIPDDEEWARRQQQAIAAGKTPAVSREESDYSRGNAFFYGVQGCDKTRRKKVVLTGSNEQQLTQIVSALNTTQMTMDDLLGSFVSVVFAFQATAAAAVELDSKAATVTVASSTAAQTTPVAAVQNEAKGQQRDEEKKDNELPAASSVIDTHAVSPSSRKLPVSAIINDSSAEIVPDLLDITQTVNQATGTLTILVTSSSMTVDSLLLQLATTGTKLVIQAADSLMNYHREVLLQHKVQVGSVQAKYSKKKNVLTVTLTLVS